MDVDSSKMEKMGIKNKNILFQLLKVLAFVFIFSSLGCANKVLKYKDTEGLKKNEEFEKVVKIEEVPTLAEVPPKIQPPLEPKTKTPVVKKEKKPKLKKPKTEKVEVPLRRQPELESDKGFSGRRPIVDPFRVGEQVKHRVKYFKVSAADLTFEVKPFVNVNGVKSYQFLTAIKTMSLFESFYAVDDHVVTLVDYETLLPSVFSLHVKETGQIKEARSFFDHQKNRATYWEKKVTEKNGVQEKRQEWDLLPYAQNIFSAVFYMRNFHWEVGTENAFVVSDDEKNLVFKAKAIRKETLNTEAGTFEAIVLKPEVTLKEKFQPIGDVFIWISNDERKYILRIETKIKIGTLVSEVYSIK
jgi:hypothetical protein